MTDTYNDNVSFLSHFNGTNNSTTFIEETGATLTPSGAAKISTAHYKFGSSSGYFDGSSNTYVVSSVLLFGTSDFTIECWIYPTTVASGYRPICYPGNNSAALYQKANTILWYDGNERCVSASISANNWYHVAVCRVGTTISVYVNGVPSGSTFSSARNFVSDETTFIGVDISGTQVFTGYIDEFRITSGVARYTSDFSGSLPSAEFDYTPVVRSYAAYSDLLACAPGAVSGYPAASSISSGELNCDVIDGGASTITGAVTYNGAPASRRVRLYDLKSGRIVQQTWSDATTGTYSFTNLKDQPYFVWSDDYLAVFNPITHLVINT